MFFKLAEKEKFAIKVSLSMVIAYLLPMALALNQPSTAAITIMVIAGASNTRESLSKGLIRIVGTAIGAAIGLLLIALFPQERMLYLGTLSLVLAVTIYLYYAYQGDSSVFMLTVLIMMMIFVQGPQDAFLYGIERTFMTLFGIVVYTLVSVFLWPQKATSSRQEEQQEEEQNRFIFFDPDYFKATLQLLTIYYASVLFWIYFNPPGGFYIVILATILGLFTTFSHIKPTLLMMLFSFGFIFSIFSYVFILPNLTYAWQLGVFIFIYTFIAFYFINPKLSIFFLLGMFLLDINNTMQYNFAIFINLLLVFYLFLFILVLFHNFPFSSKPERLFLLTKERFFYHLEKLLQKNSNSKYHQRYMQHAMKKMQFWASKIDTNYFHTLTQEDLENFTQECMQLAQKALSPDENAILPTIKQEVATLQKNASFEILKMNRF